MLRAAWHTCRRFLWLNPFPAQQSLPFFGFLRIRQALITLDGQDLRGNASSRHRKPARQYTLFLDSCECRALRDTFLSGREGDLQNESTVDEPQPCEQQDR